jgi:hypothetical protein
MKKYNNSNELARDIRLNIIKEGETILFDERENRKIELDYLLEEIQQLNSQQTKPFVDPNALQSIVVKNESFERRTKDKTVDSQQQDRPTRFDSSSCTILQEHSPRVKGTQDNFGDKSIVCHADTSQYKLKECGRISNKITIPKEIKEDFLKDFKKIQEERKKGIFRRKRYGGLYDRK